MEKLDSKQVPVVIGLAVVSLGLLGWTGYSYASSQRPAPPAPVQAEETSPAPAPPSRLALNPDDPERSLMGAAASDPFSPGPGGGPASLSPIQVRALPAAPARRLASPAQAVQPAPLPPAPERERPARPQVVVRGIIDAEDEHDMAIVEVGSEHRIVMKGDILGFRHRLGRIVRDGIWLYSHADEKFLADKYFVPLGASGQQPRREQSPLPPLPGVSGE